MRYQRSHSLPLPLFAGESKHRDCVKTSTASRSNTNKAAKPELQTAFKITAGYLVERHLREIKTVCRDTARKNPAADISEIESFAVLEAIKIAERFLDPKRYGSDFWTYAKPQLKYAIGDYVFCNYGEYSRRMARGMRDAGRPITREEIDDLDAIPCVNGSHDSWIDEQEESTIYDTSPV